MGQLSQFLRYWTPQVVFPQIQFRSRVPPESVVTPCHSPNGAALVQFVEFVQFDPSVPL